jgi:O-antigen/teichoic acid export membrane protein
VGVNGAAGNRSAGLAGGVVLGVAAGLSTALGYAFTVVLARSFTVADYGALVALLGAGLIGTIPAAGFQYVVARRTVALALPAGRNDGSSLRLAALTGVALLAAGAAIAPLAESWLHLHSVQPTLALAFALIPLTLSGAFQGALLGHSRFGALGSMYVLAAAARLAGGVLTALAGWGVTGAICTLAGAAVLSTAFGWLLTEPRSWLPAAGDRVGPLARDVLQACSTVAGILVLTNTDVLLARHYLDAETSGAYGIASLFAKAVLWVSQFVAQAAYPALAAPGGRHRLLFRALAATAGIGLVGVAGIAIFGGALVRQATGGTEYDVSTGLLTAFALLGVAWSLAQVLLLAAVAVGDRRPGRLLWALIVVEAGLVAAGPHSSPGQILAVCTVAVVAFVAVVAVLEWTRPTGRPARPEGPPQPVGGGGPDRAGGPQRR